MSAHCYINWTAEKNATDLEAEIMAEAMRANRGYASDDPERWTPGCFAVLCPADGLIFQLAMLLDRSDGVVNDVKLADYFKKSLEDSRVTVEQYESVKDASLRIFKHLGVWEEI